MSSTVATLLPRVRGTVIDMLTGVGLAATPTGLAAATGGPAADGATDHDA